MTFSHFFTLSSQINSIGRGSVRRFFTKSCNHQESNSTSSVPVVSKSFLTALVRQVKMNFYLLSRLSVALFPKELATASILATVFFQKTCNWWEHQESFPTGTVQVSYRTRFAPCDIFHLFDSWTKHAQACFLGAQIKNTLRSVFNLCAHQESNLGPSP